jgi:1-acyl-sn-glycerol-3-phosphate acyltransferase
MPTIQMRALHRTMGPALRSWFRLEVSGAEHVPGEGGVLLASNHRSLFDHIGMFAACPRPMRFLGKQELARGPAGWFNMAMGMVPVERGSADVAAIGTVVRLLTEGEVVGAFPEGTRSPTGHLYRFRSGAARIAAASGKPVVPVGIVGTAELWPVGGAPPRHRPARGSVRVAFGPVLAPPGSEPRSRRAFTAALYDAVAALCGQHPAEGFAPISVAEPGRPIEP